MDKLDELEGLIQGYLDIIEGANPDNDSAKVRLQGEISGLKYALALLDTCRDHDDED